MNKIIATMVRAREYSTPSINTPKSFKRERINTPLNEFMWYQCELIAKRQKIAKDKKEDWLKNLDKPPRQVQVGVFMMEVPK